MDITFHGANCFKITTKNSSVVIDDNLAVLGAKTVLTETDTAAYTQTRLNDGKHPAKLVLDSPGDYELTDLTVMGFQAKAYTDMDNERSATIFKFLANDFQVVVLGHVSPKLSPQMLEDIGVVDVLILPVGGSGYTLDAEDAAAVIKLIEPKVSIPSHYADSSLNYEMPQRDVSEFLTKIGASPEPVKVLKLKGEIEPGVVLLSK